MSRSVSFLTVLALLLAVAADASPADTVREFYARYAAGDLHRSAALWVPGERQAFEQHHSVVLRARCMRLESLDLRSGDAKAGSITVEADATFAIWKAATAQRLVRRVSTVRLRHAGDGWRIVEWVDDNAAIAGPELAEALTKRAVTALNEGRHDEARALNDRARGIAAEWHDDRVMSLVIGVDSIVARLATRMDDAVARGRESRVLADRSGDPDARAVALLRLIRALRMTVRDAPIDDLLAEGLALADAVEDLSIIAMIATQAAAHHDVHGRFGRALESSILAEQYATASGDVAARIGAHLNLGGAYLAKLDCYLAVPHYEAANELARRAGFHLVSASVLSKLGNCAVWRDDRAEGLRLLREGADVLLAAGAWRDAAVALAEYATYSIESGDLAAARPALAEARDAAVRSGDVAYVRSIDEQAFGHLYLAEHRYEDALRVMAGGDDANVHANRAKASRALGRFDDAEESYRASIALLEKARAGVSVDPRQMRQYAALSVGVSLSLVDLLAECGRDADALQVLEASRANVLRDVLAAGGIDRSLVLNEADRRQLDEIESRLSRLNRAAAARKADSRTAQDIALARLELAEHSARLVARADPARPLIQSMAPADVRDLPGSNVYVSYAVLEARTIVFTAHAGCGGRCVRSAVIPVGIRELRQRVNRFTRQLERRDFAIASAAEDLYDLLLRPVARAIPPGSRVCIIPDRDLWRLPFHALKVRGGKYVAELFTVTYAPSITVATELASQRPHRPSTARLAAFGDPFGSLPDAGSEVRQLAALYGPSRATTFVNGDATEAAFRENVATHDVIHVAAHAGVDNTAPIYSAVLLKPGQAGMDGRVEARELAWLDLRGKLVVLSACETARGDVSTADGVVGLPWALVAAGARASVLSQWRVDSAAATRLMTTFHRSILKGLPESEALRAAQRTLIRSADYSHPYYWASFLLIGG